MQAKDPLPQLHTPPDDRAKVVNGGPRTLAAGACATARATALASVAFLRVGLLHINRVSPAVRHRRAARGLLNKRL